MLTQEFVFSALDAEKAGEKFSINFDDVWAFSGYTRKDNALRFLSGLKGLKRGLHYSSDRRNPITGASFVDFTVDGFKFFLAKSNTEQGDSTLWTLIEIEKAYRANLERQFKSAIDPEIEKLRAELNFVKTELDTFKSQLSAEFDFDLDTTHHLSGIAANRKYVIGIVLENFRVGVDFIVDDIARPNKAGLPQHKYYLKESVHNSLLVALRSVKGVPINQLPPYIVIETAEYFKLSDKKNRRFPNQKGSK